MGSRKTEGKATKLTVWFLAAEHSPLSLLQFKTPPQNPFAAGGAAAYFSGLRLFIQLLIIYFIFVFCVS